MVTAALLASTVGGFFFGVVVGCILGTLFFFYGGRS